jgi:ParB-like chromosome segregation protein Spo0J
MQFHEAAKLFPMMEGDELQSLTEDIKKHGLQCPIEVCGGKILDGRNRYRACHASHVTAKFIAVNPPDPISYVISLNLIDAT